MSVLRSLLTAGVLAPGLLRSLNGTTATPAAQASDDRYGVAQQRNPDAVCLDCHKPDTEGMYGEYALVTNPNNKLSVTCTNCHGQPSSQHHEGAKDVIRFNEPMYEVGEQNSVCMSCRLSEWLQKTFRPHDVHVTKVACASCHSLHPQQDTMQTLSDKGRIKICVDCHNNQRTNLNFNLASVPLLKEQPWPGLVASLSPTPVRWQSLTASQGTWWRERRISMGCATAWCMTSRYASAVLLVWMLVGK